MVKKSLTTRKTRLFTQFVYNLTGKQWRYQRPPSDTKNIAVLITPQQQNTRASDKLISN